MVFRYTRGVIDKIVEDLRRLLTIFKRVTQLVTILYLVYAILTKVGVFWANVGLLAFTVAYIIVDMVMQSKNSKLAKKITTRILKWSRIIIKAYTLGITMYSLYTATTRASAVSIIIATLMIILFVLQVVIEILASVIIDKKDLLVEAWEQDIADIKKPVTNAKNVIKKITFQPIEEQPKPSERLVKIAEKHDEKVRLKKTAEKEEYANSVEEYREKVREEKKSKKEERKRARLIKKGKLVEEVPLTKKQKRRLKKEEKRLEKIKKRNGEEVKQLNSPEEVLLLPLPEKQTKSKKKKHDDSSVA